MGIETGMAALMAAVPSIMGSTGAGAAAGSGLLGSLGAGAGLASDIFGSGAAGAGGLSGLLSSAGPASGALVGGVGDAGNTLWQMANPAASSPLAGMMGKMIPDVSKAVLGELAKPSGQRPQMSPQAIPQIADVAPAINFGAMQPFGLQDYYTRRFG